MLVHVAVGILVTKRQTLWRESMHHYTEMPIVMSPTHRETHCCDCKSRPSYQAGLFISRVGAVHEGSERQGNRPLPVSKPDGMMANRLHRKGASIVTTKTSWSEELP